MDRAQKEKVVEELGLIFESSGVVVVAHYTGLTVAEMQELRARAREAECSVRVAKNRLAKIALQGKSYDQTYFCNAEKGAFADSESEVFAMWKQKLKKHEEKTALLASYTYRNEKRIEKQRQK